MKLSAEEKAQRAEHRAIIRKVQAEAIRENIERSQLPVRELTITIEWAKSRMWGMNPHATVFVLYQDGTAEKNHGYTCSGCGYDKESTVIAQVFNDYLKYKLYDRKLQEKWKKEHEGRQRDEEHPYGLYLPGEYQGSYNGGVGTGCYYDIAKFIGGRFEHVAGGKTFDVFKYTDA
jgi:hypothetical protein